MRLRQLRKQNNLSMKELGRLLGCSESTISLYERGKREPGVEMLTRMGEVFHVSVDYLLGRAEDPAGEIGRAVAAAFSGLEDQQLAGINDIYRALEPARKKQLAEYANYLYLLQQNAPPEP